MSARCRRNTGEPGRHGSCFYGVDRLLKDMIIKQGNSEWYGP